MTEKEAFIVLNLLPKIGPVRVRRLLEGLGSATSILSASPSTLQSFNGIGPDSAKAIANWQSEVDLDRELADVERAGANVLTLEDEEYPEHLRRIHAPPLVLYVLGDVEERDRHAVGVVGSRRATRYGLSMAKKFSFQLASAGVTVVSGLARGIDTAAHEAAVAANGRTIAVIGSGLLELYPPENKALAEKISGFGAVVSEFPMRYKPDRQSFPQRNRIIAGWGEGVLVVEAPGRSGALITADQALEQDRTVYAIPGPVDRASSQGCNRLIQQGAKLVMDGSDIIEDMLSFGDAFEMEATSSGSSTPDMPTPAIVSGPESKILEVMGKDETSIDEIFEKTGIAPSEAGVFLMRLQMKGLVRQLPGGYYVCAD
ncbi:MAG: DNA-processing protein DprA [Verrucomicrobiota bacterium]